jgi:uncharacterized Zn-binding protein involved in type VI secretion
MPSAARLADLSSCPADTHGCVECSHSVVGPSVSGSPNVNVNSRPAMRVGDKGVHAACCGPNTWKAMMGSATVHINGKPAHRLSDRDRHCGGIGVTITGSNDVFVGGPPTAEDSDLDEAMKAAEKADGGKAPATNTPGGPVVDTPGQAPAGPALQCGQQMNILNGGVGERHDCTPDELPP